MTGYIPFPNISPEVFSVTFWGHDFALRWYALAYITGLVIGWRLVVALVRRPALWPADRPPMVPEQVENLLTWVILGVVLGGRIGFVLFYEPGHFLDNPADILQVWHGGMSFHGGFLGVVVAGVLFCWRERVPMLSAADALAIAAPPGLFLGRIANFINAELWGMPTRVPWAVAFPGYAAQDCGPTWLTPVCTRHPSQLYEAGMEGLLLFLVLIGAALGLRWLRAPGRIAGIFFIGYGLARFTVEFFRQADAQFITPDNPAGNVIQFGALGGFSMGQVLSLPMIAIGLIFVLLSRRRA